MILFEITEDDEFDSDGEGKDEPQRPQAQRSTVAPNSAPPKDTRPAEAPFDPKKTWNAVVKFYGYDTSKPTDDKDNQDAIKAAHEFFDPYAKSLKGYYYFNDNRDQYVPSMICGCCKRALINTVTMDKGPNQNHNPYSGRCQFTRMLDLRVFGAGSVIENVTVNAPDVVGNGSTIVYMRKYMIQEISLPLSALPASYTEQALPSCSPGSLSGHGSQR